MLKFAIFACLCAVALVESHEHHHSTPKSVVSSLETQHVRVSRQSMPTGGFDQQQQSSNGQGDLSMKGLGNIPDPTEVIAKGQEIAKQFMNGRRRRQVEALAPLVSLIDAKHVRVARQSMPTGGFDQQQQTSNGQGDLSMKGLGNIPDPTQVIAKAQEIAKQFFGGRRRRSADHPAPNGHGKGHDHDGPPHDGPHHDGEHPTPPTKGSE